MDGRARDLPGQTGADSRPLLIPALAFLGGILFADAFPHPAAPAIAIGGVALCAALAWLAHAGADRRAAVAALAAVAFGAGIARLAHERRIDPRDIGRAGEGAAEIEGVIARPPEAFGASGENDGAPPGSWFLLDVERVAGAEGWRDARGTVRVVVGEGTPALRGGDRVRATGWLAAPRGARNPGEFDFAAHLARSGIRRLLRVGRPASVVVEGRGPWPEVARGVLRERIARGLDAAGPRGALYRALLLGDRSALAPDLEQAFVTSGTAHVLAVSGLNLVLVIAMAAGLARLLGAGARGAGLAALAVALGYAALVGWSPPVTRAAAMAAALLGGRLLWRRGDMVNSLAAAALVVLAVNPEDLFGAGFHLSFAAVLALVVAARPLARALGAARISGPAAAPRRAAADLVSASLAAGLATAPITWAWFNIVCPVSLAANLLVVPLAALLLGLGAAAGIVGAISPEAVAAVAPVLAAPAAAGEFVVRALGTMPGGHAWVPGPPAGWAVASLAVLALAVRRPRAAAALLVPLAAWPAIYFARPAPTEFRATFLDVGQGAAAVLEFPDGDAWVVDAGASGRSDPGERVAAPYLWTRRRTTIHTLVLTHADADHISGAASLIRRFRVRRLVISESFLTDPRARAVLVAAAEVPTLIVRDGDTLFTRSGIPVRVLGPPAATPGWKPNDTSVVLFVESNGLSLLLTGDAERRAVAALMRDPPRADVLQIPHHGGASSRSLELPAHVRPAIAVASAREWFLSPDVEADYRALGVPVEGTWKSGAVMVVGEGGRWRIERYR